MSATTIAELDRLAYVAALDVPPGAVIVAKSTRKLTVEQAKAIEAAIEHVLPGRRVLVLPPEIDLDVMRDEAIAQ